MTIHVTCPTCDARLRVAAHHAGKQGKCPKCRALLLVPSIETRRIQPPPAPPPLATRVAEPFPPAHATAEVVANMSESASSAPHVVAVATAESPRTSAMRRSRFAAIPVWGWALFATNTVAIAAVVFFFLTLPAERAPQQATAPPAQAPPIAHAPPVAEPVPVPAALVEDEEVHPAQVSAVVEPPAVESPAPVAGASLEDIVAYIKEGIVKIETADTFNNRRGLGSGFIVDSTGLVATNYHVVADATKAEVVFSSGAHFAVEGYVAVDKEADLAILRLADVPKEIKALKLKVGEGPRDASQVYAIGHPLDNEFTTTGGIVGRVLRTKQLPTETREWLRESHVGGDNNLWVQHDAKIAPGNSGGPLINSAGEVVGVNSWVNQKLGLGYAIHARHLQQLMEDRETAVVPLKLRRRVVAEPVRPELSDMQAASQRIKQLCTMLAAKDWQPKFDEDCEAFDELARTITAVKYLQSNPESQAPMPMAEQRLVLGQADEAVATLRAVQWRDREQIQPLNAHAGKTHAPYSGVFLFGTVQQIQSGDEQERGLLVAMRGSKEKFFVRLDETDQRLRVGESVLVLGIAHPATLRIGNNSRRPTTAQVLLSKVVLPVGK